MSELLEVEPITTGRMIDRLQDAALVERRADPNDRRAWRLFLTSKGEMLFASIVPLASETLADALDGIEEDDRRHLMDMLETIRGNLSRRAPFGAAAHG